MALVCLYHAMCFIKADLHEEEHDLARDVAADAVHVHVALAGDPAQGSVAC